MSNKTIKPKKCIICFEWFKPRFKTTEQCCGVTCAIAHATNLRKAKEQREWKKEKSILKDKLKTHSDWSKELQIEINTIVRLIDKDSICISSLKPLNPKYDAGHRYSVGAFPQLRFNLFNIHAQSVNQNQYLSGNPDGYDHGLESVYGIEYLNNVQGLRLKYPSLKLPIDELIKAKARAKKIVSELKALDMVYPPKVRIELRKKFNKLIGIYK